MSFIISVHSVKAFKEFLLPAVNDTEHSLILNKDIFRLDHDIDILLEVIGHKWRIRHSDEYYLVETTTKSDYFDRTIADHDLLSIILPDQETLSIMVRETDSTFMSYKKYVLPGDTAVTIGKSENNVISYDTLNLISREHAIIRKSGEQYILEDRSANGVFVNSVRIVGSKQLEFGDSINIFQLCIFFLGDMIAVNSYDENIVINTQILQECQQPEHVLSGVKKIKEKKYFHRAPRTLLKIYDDEMEIEAPPQPKTLDKKPIGMLIGPSMTMALPMLLGCGLAIYSTRASGTASSAFMYTGLVTAIASALIGTTWALVNLNYDRKKNKEEERQRFEAYGEYLIRCSNAIKEKYEKNISNLNSMYLSSEACCVFDEDNSALWNRNIDHNDFLSHRLGIGDIPFQMRITVPRDKFTLVNDYLSEKPKMIKDSYNTLHDVPICVDLIKHRIVGVIGGEKKWGSIDIMHNLVAQIATSNCYTDVKMAFIYDEADDENNSWGYLKWFPHVWAEDRKTRFIAKNKSQAGDVLYEITKALRIRMENKSSFQSKEKLSRPQYILFVANPKLLEGEMINKYIYDHEENCGLTTVFLVDTYEELPNACEFIIQNDSGFQGMYNIDSSVEERVAIRYDKLSNIQLEGLARRLADIEVTEAESGGEIPSSLSFFEMYKINRLGELNVLERWRKNRTYESMKALIGEKAGGTPWYLDIHEKYHGPHGLIAGTTGSGKSETLQTYILSLALNFSPDDVGFFIIDYKGGGMANLFDGLPHMIGQISNLSGNQVKRAMVSIKSENRRRQRIFNEYGVNNINLYTRLYKKNEASYPVPHMFIIIDEFAELKREEPDFMRELISVAQVGRSLGVHLILATQKPSGTVDDNIWSNSKFRLCLRVQDRQDSNDMLHRPDAAYITQAGRCYMQVGNDELFELFQSGFSGAVYDENDADARVDIARMVSSTGKAALIGNRLKIKKKEAIKRNWVLQLLEVIDAVSDELSIQYTDVVRDSVQWDAFIKRVFVFFEEKDIDYAYSEYNALRIKDLIRAFAESNAARLDNKEEQADAVLAYVAENKALKLPEKKEKTQLDAVVSYLRMLADENGYDHNLQLWLPLLPSYLYLEELTDFKNCFDGTAWNRDKGEWNIEIALGKYDDPENQSQDTFKVNFSLNGHHAIIGTVVSGKSTLLQTMLFALVNKYTPEEINIYAIDFSAKMLSAFERMPHVGGVMYENENEKIAKFFNMLMGILEERKQLFRGGNYSQYVRVNGIVLPTIILFIDNYANFKNKTNNQYEDLMIQLSKDGVNYGIYLVITGGGFSSLEIPSRIGDNLRTVICLEMSDKYQYSDALRTVHIDTLPEVNIKGRGLAHVGERLLEFQTALAFEAPDDFKRMEMIQEMADKMRQAWNGKYARTIPEIPEKPVWSEFVQLDETVKMASDDRHLPVGYDYENASVYGIDLLQNFCYIVTGKARSGKTNMLKIILSAALLRKEEVVVIDFGSEFTRLVEQHGLLLIDDDKKLYDFFAGLLNEFVARNNKKRELVQQELSDEDIYLAMREQFSGKHIIVANLTDFVLHVTQPKEGGDTSAFVKNLLDKGRLHNVFFYAAYSQEDSGKVAGNPLFELYIRYKTGIHFGGNVSAQRILNFDHIPYTEQPKPQKAGTGMLPYREEEEVSKVVIPLLKG